MLLSLPENADVGKEACPVDLLDGPVDLHQGIEFPLPDGNEFIEIFLSGTSVGLNDDGLNDWGLGIEGRSG